MDADGNPNLPSKKSADSESEDDEADGKFIFTRFALRDDSKSEKSFVGPDEEARLMVEIEQLELEEQALICRKRVEELQRKVEAKNCNVEKLKQQEFGQLENMNFGPLKVHGEGKMLLINVGPSSKTLNTNKKLKDLMGKSYDGAKTLLDHLLGVAVTTGEAVDFLTNPDFGKENGSVNPEQMFGVGGVNELLNANGCLCTASNAKNMKLGSSLSLLSADGLANIMLHPWTPGKSRPYLRIVNFVDDCIQRNQEELLAENGLSQLLISYGAKKIKLDQVSMPHFVIASLRILYHLMESKQIDSYNEIKHYLAYDIKCMELAMRYEWQSVLKYDDEFRQHQALHDVPWVYESHHLHSVKLFLLALPVNLYRRNPHNSGLGAVGRAHTPRTAQDLNTVTHTDDGHVIYRSFNSLKRCTFHFCKYSHVCNKKLTDGRACGLGHPCCKHDGN